MIPQEVLASIPRLYETEHMENKTFVAKLHVPRKFYFDQQSGQAVSLRDFDWKWYIVEYDPETQDCFGLVDGYEKEWGYFNLKEFEATNKSYGFPIIQWDPLFSPVVSLSK